MSNSDTKTVSISLSHQNASKYGFARFIDPHDIDGSGDLIQRKVILAQGGQYREFWGEITVNPDDLIILKPGKNQRLVERPEFRIQKAMSDTGPMKFLSERAGWNQTSEDLSQYVRMDPEGNFLAGFRTGKQVIPLGSGAVFPIGTTLSWISMILVHPEVRRQGIASALLRECLAYARLSKQSPVVGLDATPEGKQVYDHLGFRDAYKIWRCKISLKNPAQHADPAISVQLVKDIGDITSFIANTGYLHRLPALDVLFKLTSSCCYIAESNNQILGFVLSRPGRRRPSVGPLMAVNKSVAGELLRKTVEHWSSKGSDQVFMDIPEIRFNMISGMASQKLMPEKALKNSFLQDYEVVPVRLFIRMYHLIEPTVRANPGAYHEKKSNSYGISKPLLEGSKATYCSTLKFIERENALTLPCLYAIGGPEIG
jgi:GNAT superfamily N-acetyltransferase